MIPPYLYHIVFLYAIIVLTIIVISQLPKSFNGIRTGSNNLLITTLLCIVLALWLGYRPVNTIFFGDTVNYAYSYSLMQSGQIGPINDGEWIWNNFMYACSQVMSVGDFFTLVDLGYFGFTLWACKRFTPNNVLFSIAMCLGALSFFSYGTNGIRNGLACSLLLLMFSYLVGNRRNQIIALFISFIAYNIHHSTALPILVSFISTLCIKSFKNAYTFWIFSIFVSLVAGGTVASIFASLGFDDRLSYLINSQVDGMFSRSGFRWDFLIYSMMPILLGYLVIVKRGIRNRTYEILLNTYTLANAFWVMVIRANYSNRFAYLSWFMYAIVLAYPLLKIDIWGEFQGRFASQIMLAHIGFTWFMSTFYWS